MTSTTSTENSGTRERAVSVDGAAAAVLQLSSAALVDDGCRVRSVCISSLPLPFHQALIFRQLRGAKNAAKKKMLTTAAARSQKKKENEEEKMKLSLFFVGLPFERVVCSRLRGKRARTSSFERSLSSGRVSLSLQRMRRLRRSRVIEK